MLNAPETGQTTEALAAALVEIERHVGNFGWDQPARLFALVPTAHLLATEPSLKGQLRQSMPGAFSSIEQEDFRSSTDLLTDLTHLSWPQTVHGVALATERSFLTTEFEADIPDDPAAAADYVANHPNRQDIRVVAGVLRGGQSRTVARLKTNPQDLLMGEDLVPALTKALHYTLT